MGVDLPLGHVLGGVALLGGGVEDETLLAALGPGGDTVHADVELGAVGGVLELGVGVGDAEGVEPGVSGALEAALVIGLLCNCGGKRGEKRFRRHIYFLFVLTGLAALPAEAGLPVAASGDLVEVESDGADVLLGDALHAGVEHAAVGGVGVSVVAVQPGAVLVGTLSGL